MGTKYIFITGGVCSSLGKGIASATIGALLEASGFKVVLQKIDPYLNVDAGTMSPYQHGEVYVTDDGAETDLDLGNYSRFTNSYLSELNSITTGKVYLKVINRERKGDYLGKTVQVIPHITGEIQNMIKKLSDEVKPDIQIIEIGGTVGDIESVPFLEAAREFYHKNKNDVIFIHLTLIPKIVVAGEYKTKPTQHSVKALREIGIFPHIILTRISGVLSKEMRRKIALFCSVEEQDVIEAPDVDNIYNLPLIYHELQVEKRILRLLGMKDKKINLEKWIKIKQKIDIIEKQKNKFLNIYVCGKYIHLNDAYKSVYESLKHAGIENEIKIHIKKIDSEEVIKNPQLLDEIKSKADGILVPGGFGSRGIEGKIKIIKLARENSIPFLGLCLGMQCMALEFARNVLKLENANSEEFDPHTEYPIIHLMEDQINISEKGGTMRLGAYKCKIKKGSFAYNAYQKEEISERHRHRYEFNNEYKQIFEENGVLFSGLNEELNLVEIMEWKNHVFGVGVQFHPEFKSKPFKPHPLFREFIKCAMKKRYN